VSDADGIRDRRGRDVLDAEAGKASGGRAGRPPGPGRASLERAAPGAAAGTATLAAGRAAGRSR
jgi:hypothetical protein